MEVISIGKSGVTTSRVGLGTWAIGGWMWGGTDEARSIATIRSAVEEEGITLIDTAPVYGFGRAEEIVGKALAGGLRKNVTIATKVGIAWRNGAPFRDGRRQRIVQELEASLRRLRTDVIDLYQVHWPDLETPLEETAKALEDMLRQGKVRALGVSNFSPRQIGMFRSFATLSAVQPPYNLFEREIEGDVLPYAAASGLTVLSYGALCRGLLSGRMRADTNFADGDLRRMDPKFQGERFLRYLAAVEQLSELARRRFDRSVLALAVRWVLDQGPTIALWGARSPDQLKAVREVEGWTIDAEAKREIDSILERHVIDRVPPTFMAPPEERPEEERSAAA